MPALLNVFTGSGYGSLSGKLYIADENVTNLRQLYWPAGVNSLTRHGSGYVYGNRNYLMGSWSANLMVDENFRALRQGIIPPQSPPTVGVGGGATDQICYLSFYDSYTDERSSLSEGFAVTGNTTRAWSVLPTVVPGETAVIEGLVDVTAGVVTVSAVTDNVTNFGQIRPGDKVALLAFPNDWAVVRSVSGDGSMLTDLTLPNAAGGTLLHRPVSRCNYVELWVSVAGALPRLSSRVPLGVTAFTEAVGTLSLGEAFLETFEPFPFCTMNATYGDRQCAAGDPRNPDTLYLSALFLHERWEGLSYRTRYGEPIVGLVGMRDYLLVLCPDSAYVLQGYTEDDLTLRGLSTDLGGMAHTTNTVVNDVAFIANNQGFWLYNGAWHQLLEGNVNKWIECYGLYRDAFERGIVVYDPFWQTIHFIPLYGTLPGGASYQSSLAQVWTAYVGDLGQAEAGTFTSPAWGWDTADYFSAFYLVPTATSFGKFLRVRLAGEVEEEDEGADGNMTLLLGHNFYGVVGGDEQEAKCLKRSWGFWYGEYAECVWSIFGGDEYAQGEDFGWRSAEGQIGALYTTYSVVVPASLFTTDTTPAPLPVLLPGANWIATEALCCHTWPEEIPGRGHTHQFLFTGRHIEFYGYGGVWGPGVAPRSVVYAGNTG